MKPVLEMRIYMMEAGPKLFAFEHSDPTREIYDPEGAPYNFIGGEPDTLVWTNGDQAWVKGEGEGEGGTIEIDGIDVPAFYDYGTGLAGPEPGVLYRIFVDYLGNIEHETTIYGSED